MRTIEIEVSDENFDKVRNILERLADIEAIRVQQIQEHLQEDTAKPALHEMKSEYNTNEVTLLSQKSFSDEWDSEEDDRYDELYKSKYPENEV